MNNQRRGHMAQSVPGGTLLIPPVFKRLVDRTGVHQFWDRCQHIPHDGLNVGSGTMFVAVPVSTDVTEVEHRHKVDPVWIGSIFLFMRCGPLAILK